MQTLFTGQNIIRLPSVGSTNNYTIEKLRQSVIPEGTVVVADEQTNGKGQRGNHWQSKPNKNLTFSVVLHPHFLAPTEQFNLTKVVSLAVYDFLINKGIQAVKIKWPNDVFVGTNKIAGILIENTLAGNHLKHSVVGVGLNVNQTDFPVELHATSLAKETGNTFDLQKELAAFCGYLEARYLQLKNGSNLLHLQYHQQLYLLNTASQFTTNGETFTGTITGTTHEGKLKIATNAKERVFDFKEICFV